VISYWELNPDIEPTEIANVAVKIVSKGMFPAKGVKSLAWYCSVTDYWGITIDEVENEAAYLNEVNQFRVLHPGLFKVFKSTLGMKVEEMLPLTVKLGKQVKG
jgi:hypothetical protein